ncbi:hypothetical protein CEUSTIGMA_g1433.t1 [Chlamydomonas eustigma]|uniref:Uncharacterized protein n=1 Tax=Chlamydomonas eustigma TaxID=1157962 RepID=A0A250WT31_9CHLO|nr:hypothetical protein CEUSTIGMA_g1433.t1 [Chlamydomonas eustigma]|eukprot:GAX73983.1 hypothetical protein CEUSTIGMA_g1433.t1 [Chlamydomonas eustigma]
MGTRVFSYERIHVLQRVAPLWIIIQNFDCHRDHHLPEQRLIPADKLLDMYAAKKLSRSTLTAGLERGTEHQLSQLAFRLPAIFFRPLEFILELTEVAVDKYRPLCSADLEAMVPPIDWCLPLHMHKELMQQQAAAASSCGNPSSSSAIIPTTSITTKTTVAAATDRTIAVDTVLVGPATTFAAPTSTSSTISRGSGLATTTAGAATTTVQKSSSDVVSSSGAAATTATTAAIRSSTSRRSTDYAAANSLTTISSIPLSAAAATAAGPAPCLAADETCSLSTTTTSVVPEVAVDLFPAIIMNSNESDNDISNPQESDETGDILATAVSSGSHYSHAAGVQHDNYAGRSGTVHPSYSTSKDDLIMMIHSSSSTTTQAPAVVVNHPQHEQLRDECDNAADKGGATTISTTANKLILDNDERNKNDEQLDYHYDAVTTMPAVPVKTVVAAAESATSDPLIAAAAEINVLESTSSTSNNNNVIVMAIGGGMSSRQEGHHLQLPFSQGGHMTTSNEVAIMMAEALSGASYWCLVHKYSEDQSKCDFNWTAQDVVSGFLSNAISPFTLIIGMDVVKDRNLPWMRPSLFVPLAAVLHLYDQNCNKRYTAVTRNDLILFNALGFRGSLAAGPNRQLVIHALAAAAGLSELSINDADNADKHHPPSGSALFAGAEAAASSLYPATEIATKVQHDQSSLGSAAASVPAFYSSSSGSRGAAAGHGKSTYRQEAPRIGSRYVDYRSSSAAGGTGGGGLFNTIPVAERLPLRAPASRSYSRGLVTQGNSSSSMQTSRDLVIVMEEHAPYGGRAASSVHSMIQTQQQQQPAAMMTAELRQLMQSAFVGPSGSSTWHSGSSSLSSSSRQSSASMGRGRGSSGFMVQLGSNSWPLPQQLPDSAPASLALSQQVVAEPHVRQRSWPQQTTPSSSTSSGLIGLMMPGASRSMSSTHQQPQVYFTHSGAPGSSTAVPPHQSNYQQVDALAAAPGTGLSEFDLNPRYQLSMGYSTPAFHLFLSSWPHPLQWWIVPDPGRAAAQGPFTGEQMVISYTRQIFTDIMLVCGMAASEFSTPQHYDAGSNYIGGGGIMEGGAYYLPPPGTAAFLPLGQLFERVRQGSGNKGGWEAELDEAKCSKSFA